MDLHELRVAARLIDGLAKRALFAEKQMVASEGQCAEWQRIAGALKAERNALRSTTIETATGSLLDAFGSLANEPRHGATDDAYRDRIVTKIHTIKLERDALRAECDDLENAIDALKKERDDLWQREGIEQKRRIDVEAERDALRAQLDTERERHKQTAAVLAQSAPKTVDVPRAHPVKAGEYVRRLTGFNTTPAGEIAQVIRVHIGAESNSYEYEILRPNGQPGAWVSKNCTPCDPPTASHDTPAGKEAAHAAAEPKPGDMVRLVREPTHTDIPAMLPWSKAFGMPGDTAIVVIMAVPDKVPSGTIPVRTGMGRCFFWPISCIEIVEDAK